MIWLEWLWEGVTAGVLKVVALWWLVPLFIVIQALKDGGWLDKVSRLMGPVLKPLRLPGDAGLPMVAGLTVGLTYGAGVILQAAEEGKLNRNQLTTMCVFLGISHALIEETILVSAIGANGPLVAALRVVLGALFGYGASWLLLRKAEASPVPVKE